MGRCHLMLTSAISAVDQCRRSVSDFYSTRAPPVPCKVNVIMIITSNDKPRAEWTSARQSGRKVSWSYQLGLPGPTPSHPAVSRCVAVGWGLQNPPDMEPSSNSGAVGHYRAGPSFCRQINTLPPKYIHESSFTSIWSALYSAGELGIQRANLVQAKHAARKQLYAC